MEVKSKKWKGIRIVFLRYKYLKIIKESSVNKQWKSPFVSVSTVQILVGEWTLGWLPNSPVIGQINYNG